MDLTTLLTDLALTVLFYTTVPLVFAFTRKIPTSKSTVKFATILSVGLVYLILSIINYLFYPEEGLPSFTPAFLWGTIAYKVACDWLDIKKLLHAEPSTESPITGSSSLDSNTVTPDEGQDLPQISVPPVGQLLSSSHTSDFSSKVVFEINSANTLTPEEIATAESQSPIETPHEEIPASPPASSHKKLAGRIPYIACIGAVMILAVACGSLGVIYFQEHQRAEDLHIELLTAKGKISTLENTIALQKNELHSLSDEKDNLDELLDISLEALGRIGYIVSGSRYYHRFYCDIYTDADEYWAHNIEYCAYLGYTPCPDCWTN